MDLKFPTLYVAVLLSASSWAQTAPAAADQQNQARVVQDPVQGGWNAVDEIPARDARTDDGFMQDRSEEHQYDMQVDFQQMRLDRNSALAERKGELNTTDRDELVRYAERIAREAPNSFEAHMAHFYAEFPAPSSFQHLDRAAMRDAGRSELIGPKLADAARRNNINELGQWSRAMKARGEVAPGLWSFADDLLASVDQDGILIAAGEMDAYPILTRQFADGQRKDVFVIDFRLLEDAAYRHRIWEKTRAKGNVPANAIGFIAALAEATERPLFLSPALGSQRIGLPQENLYVIGLALQYARNPINNIPLLEKRWGQMKKTTEAGPLSRNYLLPGVVLLKHYREQQDETRSARMEHELRQLAKKLNATQDLYRMGVFQH